MKAFDDIVIEMRLADVNRNKIKMEFDYYKDIHSNLILAAKGNQEVSCMKKDKDKLSPVEIPDELRDS